MTQRYDFKMTKGTDARVLFLCSAECGNPATGENTIDLSGFTAQMTIKQSEFGQPIDVLTSDDGRIVIDTEKASLCVTFPHKTTAKFPAAKLIYELSLISSEGEITQILFGNIYVHSAFSSSTYGGCNGLL